MPIFRALGTDTLVTVLSTMLTRCGLPSGHSSAVPRWPILAAGSIIATLMLDAHLGMVFLLATALVAASFLVHVNLLHFTRLQKRLDTVSLYMRQILSGIRVIIRAFRHEAGRNSSPRQFRLERKRRLTLPYSALLNPATFLVVTPARLP